MIKSLVNYIVIVPGMFLLLAFLIPLSGSRDGIIGVFCGFAILILIPLSIAYIVINSILGLIFVEKSFDRGESFTSALKFSFLIAVIGVALTLIVAIPL